MASYDTTPNGKEAALARLYSIRESIDNIDAALVHMLAERFKFTQLVGTLKAEHGLPPADPDREREQIQRLRRLAEASHLDPEFAEKWFNFVVAEVIHHHFEAAARPTGRAPGDGYVSDRPGSEHESGPKSRHGSLRA